MRGLAFESPSVLRMSLITGDSSFEGRNPLVIAANPESLPPKGLEFPPDL